MVPLWFDQIMAGVVNVPDDTLGLSQAIYCVYPGEGEITTHDALHCSHHSLWCEHETCGVSYGTVAKPGSLDALDGARTDARAQSEVCSKLLYVWPTSSPSKCGET